MCDQGALKKLFQRQGPNSLPPLYLLKHFRLGDIITELKIGPKVLLN